MSNTQVNVVPSSQTITNTISYINLFNIQYLLNIGATCQVNCYDSSNNLISSTSTSLTPTQYQNWTTDTDFIGFVCDNLGYTQAATKSTGILSYLGY